MGEPASNPDVSLAVINSTPPGLICIVELPGDLCPGGAPAIAAIIGRYDQTITRAIVLLGKNFAFNGDPADSYITLASIKSFAFCGQLAADFPADTAFIEVDNAIPNLTQAPADPVPLAAGLQIQLVSCDLILPEVSDFDCICNSLLVFVGSEIMSVNIAQLNGQGNYSLTVLRGQFGTTIDDHVAGDPIFILPLNNLVPIQHPYFAAGNTARFKFPVGNQQAEDVASTDIVLNGARWS